MVKELEKLKADGTLAYLLDELKKGREHVVLEGIQVAVENGTLNLLDFLEEHVKEEYDRIFETYMNDYIIEVRVQLEEELGLKEGGFSQ